MGLLTALIFLFYQDKLKDYLTIGVVINMVIATATVIAVIIHLSSVVISRRDRVWDANKHVLMDFREALSEVIEANDYYSKIELARIFNEEPPDEENKPKEEVYYVYSKKHKFIKDVYGSILDANLIKAMDVSYKENNKINGRVHQEDLNILEAYSKSSDLYGYLKRELDIYIAKKSGIKVRVGALTSLKSKLYKYL
ncbi:hypothetical protein OW493_06530 [Cobetia sp. 14N.309.X.WAT.E.A4]|uniref:hypothetical protein n=1 Tax=Cobetia sp. 14N.309.X.WAT.E.A4 TaxID=2998323 RepID=UPI0025B00B18|nr:hypothetical protein [Cobetia sp. 14N.309.X.WAT.E.A4]MDN2656101.1 hypothetical protein [Cobetia sp. 14N.309.X.WAT.E.A4]